MSASPRFPDTMLLAAGLGTRLRPVTETLPKPLVEIAGQALIDRIIANARAEGATRFVVNAHHHAGQIEAHFAADPAFTVLVEPTLLGTGGGVRNALAHLATDPILVMNTDAFWQPGADRPLTRLLARHRAASPAMTLLCVHPLRAAGFARSHDFCLDPLGRVTRDSGLPVIYAGAALIEKSVFADTPDGAFSLYGLIEQALEAETLAGAVLDASWFHVGDAAGLEAAEAALR